MGDSTCGLAPLNVLVVFLVFGMMLLVPWSELWRKLAVREVPAKGPRPLKPKTGADCPLCRMEQGAHRHEGSAAVLPRPWREGRSPRGRKKASVSREYA